MGRLLMRLGWLILILTGCQEAPVVAGFPGKAPSHVGNAVVWGNDDRTVGAAIAWLQRQGLIVFDQGRIQRILTKNASTEQLPLFDEPAIRVAASEVGADIVVFSDRTGDVRPPMVSVKGVDAQSGRVIWGGNARYGSFDGLPTSETLTELTDQALMSAWGLEPKED
jgi:hypothetical protein